MPMSAKAMDAAGKDGTIKHVMSGINPQGCQVFSFSNTFWRKPGRVYWLKRTEHP